MNSLLAKRYSALLACCLRVKVVRCGSWCASGYKRKHEDLTGGRGTITPGAKTEAVLANKRITSARTAQAWNPSIS